MANVVEACDPLWAATIERWEQNPLAQVVRFDLAVLDGKRRNRHTLEIRDCESMMWIENRSAGDGVRFKEWDYYELTSIHVGDAITVRSDDKWLRQFEINFNVKIEIWNSALLIKADEIIVDGQAFALSDDGHLG